MALIIPNDYKDKTTEEMYKDLHTIADSYMKLKDALSDLHAEVKLRDSQLQLQRADITKSKAMVGHKNIEIQNLKFESDNIIDISRMDTILQDGKLKKLYK